MTTTTLPARWLFSALLSTALGLAGAACSDSDDTGKDSSPITADSSINTPVADTGTPSTGDAGASGGACESAMYSELGDGCASCACKVDPVLAPACQKPCWDFLACSFAAQAGKCAASAAGGAATRPAFEACTMEECGNYLAVPGAEVISSYRMIIGACAQPMGGVPAACADDITKIQASQKK